MISAMLLAMTFAAAPADKINDARRTYSACLNKLVRTELDAHADPATFEEKLGASCKTQEAAFRTAIVTVDVAAGIGRTTAEENASGEINDFAATSKEAFLDYFNSKTRPQD